MSSKIVLSVLCLAGHPESVFPYTVVLYYGGPPNLVPGGACQGGLKVASVAPILASEPGLGGPSRGPRGAPQEQIWCRNRVLRANLVPWSGFGGLRGALADPWILGEDPWGRPPGWTPGSWPDPWILGVDPWIPGRTPGFLAGPLDSGGGPLDSWLDPWILAGSLDFVGFPSSWQILVLEVRFWCWRSF